MTSVLRKARALISDEKNWTQGVLARNAKGESVFHDSSTATCWCSIGALSKFNASSFKLRESVYLLGTQYTQNDVVKFNDCSSHDEVLWMFDLAIAMEET